MARSSTTVRSPRWTTGDLRRALDDGVPTGFKAYDVRTRAVKGHPFRLDLSEEDRKGLIAFLETL